MSRVYNFSAGPATLPLAVLEQAKTELLDWHKLGMSVMEISHRSDAFMEVASEAETNLRELLNIPQNYKVLFLQGGARSQFAMVPMNLLRGKTTADYLDIGIWSGLALNEAKRYCDVRVVASAESSHYTTIPDVQNWDINPDAAYFHYVDNETINGVEFPFIPQVPSLLVSDMSSNILSRPIDVSRFALIYAGAQKNMGPAGVTIVIVREDLIDDPHPLTPSMFRYALHAKEGSMYNTPPTFAWYMVGLVLKWLKAQGGVAEIAKQNQRKADKLYNYLDQSDFYFNSIDPSYRSRMNVVFSIGDPLLEKKFLLESTQGGLANLKGHKLVGGMRASIYNALPEAGVDSLVHFMDAFEKRHRGR